MQKIKRVFRKRRNEPENSPSSNQGAVAPDATVSASDLLSTSAATKIKSSSTSRLWSSNATPSDASNRLRHISSSSHMAAAAAARAVAGYSEHVADRNMVSRTAAEDPGEVVQPDASALAAEDRMKRLSTYPHSTDDITSELEQLKLDQPDAAVALAEDEARTTDNTVEERVAPAVIHETVIPTIHHIRNEVITKDIHTHDVYHYVQPVVDTEVLPPKHYLQDGEGELIEIPADQIPENSRITETYNQHVELPHPDSNASPLQRIIPTPVRSANPN